MNKSINFINTVPALLMGLALVSLSFIVKEEFLYFQNTDLTSLKKLRADIDKGL